MFLYIGRLVEEVQWYDDRCLGQSQLLFVYFLDTKTNIERLIINGKKMLCLGFEPGTVGWKEQKKSTKLRQPPAPYKFLQQQLVRTVEVSNFTRDLDVNPITVI